MKSIREFNTSGMLLYQREELLKYVKPINVGETVWYAGDCWSYPEAIKVTEGNQEEITMFWNSLYFDKEEDATRQNNIARMEYNRWLTGNYNYWMDEEE